jgi:hypothetical protein
LKQLIFGNKLYFTPVNSRDVLENVIAMPIRTWHYKAQPKNVRHLCPVAQDFNGAFGLGEDDRTFPQ